jgi:hypothetical protein
MSGDHNQYQKPDKQCKRCGEVNPAEIHTCTPQKPVAWMRSDKGHIDFHKHPDYIPLYAAPPQREWKGLTDEEIMDACSAVWASHPIEVGRVVEAKLKEKNS